MSKFNIALDYNRKPEAIKDLSNAALTEDYISFAVKAHYKDLDSQWRRVWGRIQRKIDAAIDSESHEMELDQSELDFILVAIKAAKFDANLSKFVVVLEDALEALKNAK